MPTQHIVKNRILRQLSADELKSVQPWLTLMDLRSSVVLHDAGQPLERVYFPVSGMISLLAVMQSGEQIETGAIPRSKVACDMAMRISACWRRYALLTIAEFF